MVKGKKKSRYPIEKILDSMEVGGFMEYFVKWEGYDEKDNSWEPRANLVGDKVFDEYEKKRIADAEKNLLSSGRPKRATDNKYAKMTPAQTPIKKSMHSSTRLNSNSEESTPVSRLKRISVSKDSGKEGDPTTQLKSNSVSKKSGKKGDPTTQLKRNSTQKQPEVEINNPIEQGHIEAPIYRAEYEQEIEQDEVEIIDVPIEQDRVEAPIYRAENEQVTSVLGCRQEVDQGIWVMCSFNKDVNDVEMTPYRIMYQRQPRILLTYFHDNAVFANPDNNA